ncbi:MAG: glycosyltransferase [Desulfobulbaceae bacterium]|nr:glycosyltransferase [Desulfobulbaceae bacterium]
MKVTVIISNYNYGRYISGAIESVLENEGEYLHEVIVVDDGSKDESREILSRGYGENEKVKLVFKENGGQFSCFRRGIELATGDILCFLDPDDRYERHYFRKIVEVYREKSYVDFIYVGYKNIGNKTQVMLKADKDFAVGISSIRVGLTGALFGSLTSALSMKRYLAKKILALPPHYDWDWRISADIVIQMGAIIAGGYMYYVAEPLMLRVIHENNAVANTVIKEPIGEYKFQMYRRRVRIFFADEYKIPVDNVPLLRREFEKVPIKTFKICWKYIEAAKKMKAPLWKKISESVRMLILFLKK